MNPYEEDLFVAKVQEFLVRLNLVEAEQQLSWQELYIAMYEAMQS